MSYKRLKYEYKLHKLRHDEQHGGLFGNIFRSHKTLDNLLAQLDQAERECDGICPLDFIRIPIKTLPDMSGIPGDEITIHPCRIGDGYCIHKANLEDALKIDHVRLCNRFNIREANDIFKCFRKEYYPPQKLEISYISTKQNKEEKITVNYQ